MATWYLFDRSKTHVSITAFAYRETTVEGEPSRIFSVENAAYMKAPSLTIVEFDQEAGAEVMVDTGLPADPRSRKQPLLGPGWWLFLGYDGSAFDFAGQFEFTVDETGTEVNVPHSSRYWEGPLGWEPIEGTEFTTPEKLADLLKRDGFDPVECGVNLNLRLRQLGEVSL